MVFLLDVWVQHANAAPMNEFQDLVVGEELFRQEDICYGRFAISQSKQMEKIMSNQRENERENEREQENKNQNQGQNERERQNENQRERE